MARQVPDGPTEYRVRLRYRDATGEFNFTRYVQAGSGVDAEGIVRRMLVDERNAHAMPGADVVSQ